MDFESAITGISGESFHVKIPFQTGPLEPAEVYEVDQQSYVHISFCDVGTCAQYKEMEKTMKSSVKRNTCLPRSWLNYPGLDCIIEYNGRRGGSYVRGKIMYVLEGIEGNPSNRDYVKCLLIDDFLEVVVHRSQLFPSNLSITDYPPFVLKCKLEFMDMFLDSPVLKDLYKLLMSGELQPMGFPFLPGQFLVQVLSTPSHPMEDQVPTVRIQGRTWEHGSSLTDILQQHLPTFKPLEYPKLGECPSVKITHYDGKGDVWYQPLDEDEEYHLISIIEHRLAMYNDGVLECSNSPPNVDQSSWKTMFCEEMDDGVYGGGGILYIFKSVADDKCYRVKKLFRFDEEDKTDDRWYVLYVDYGNVAIVPEFERDTNKRLLVPACLVDQNLAFIPPQCLPARFIGASCNVGRHTGVDMRKFMKYLGSEQSVVKIELKSFKGDDSLGLAPVDVKDNEELLDRLVPAYYVDHGFNYLPFPCVPMKYIREEVPIMDEMLPHPSIYVNETKKFDRQKFLEEKRNQPVSLFLNEFIMKLERSGGRLDGGLLLPQLDVLLKIKGKEEEGFKSLYQIYHTNEFCDKHGSKIPFEWDWNPVSRTTSFRIQRLKLGEIREIKDDSELDSGLGSFGDREESDKSSKGSTEDANVNLEGCSEKPRDSWVDWAVATFGLCEKLTAGDGVSSEKDGLLPPRDDIVHRTLWGLLEQKARRKSPATPQHFATSP